MSAQERRNISRHCYSTSLWFFPFCERKLQRSLYVGVGSKKKKKKKRRKRKKKYPRIKLRPTITTKTFFTLISPEPANFLRQTTFPIFRERSIKFDAPARPVVTFSNIFPRCLLCLPSFHPGMFAILFDIFVWDRIINFISKRRISLPTTLTKLLV